MTQVTPVKLGDAEDPGSAALEGEGSPAALRDRPPRHRARRRTALALLLAAASWVGLPAQVVINEIHYHPRSDLQEDEFLELHNIGPGPADLTGWALTDGVQFSFPAGTTISPGGFLVVARDAARIRDRYGLAPETALGNYEGALENAGERVELTDASGKSADSVEYLDEFPWPTAADGGGPSLECIDPARENSTPRNWLPSENRDWVKVTVPGTATSTRLYLYLEGAGECRIDGVTITDAETGSAVPFGGDFESGLDGWTAAGTHASSAATAEDAHSGSGSLRLVATGPGQGADMSVQRQVEGLVTGRSYVLELWAKPILGNSSLISRISGGGIIARTDLRRKEGTPGARNTVRGNNLPPLVSRFGTSPALPAPGEPVILFAAVQDDDPVRVEGTRDDGSGPVTVELRDDGLSGDGVARDGLFAGPIPPEPLGTIVDFRVRAVDSGGLETLTPIRRYPVSGPVPTSNLPVYSIFIRPADWEKLNADIWTETYFPAVFAHGDQVITDAGLRFRGGRPRLFRKKSLKLDFPEEQLFEGRDTVNLNAAAMDDDYLSEPLAYWLYERAGVAASKTRFVRVELNGAFWGLFIDVEQVEEPYLQRFGLDPEGALYKAVGVVGSLRKLEGVLYNGQEYTYPSQYEKKTQEDEPYDDLISFIHGLHDTAPAAMEAHLSGVIEVDSVIDYLAATNALCVWDSIQHNYYLYRDTRGDGRWRILPWDLDHTWGEWEWAYYHDDTYHLLMGTEAHPFAGVWYTWNKLWTELLRVPRYRQRYMERIGELLNTVYAEGPIFRKIDEMRAAIEPTVLLDEAKWPDALEPLHTGPQRTMAQEIPLLKANVAARRRHLASVLGLTLEDVPAQASFRRGDVDGSLSVDIADAMKLLWFLFLGGNALDCADAADADDDGTLGISDSIAILGFLFAREAPPPGPGPAGCGVDPSPDGLSCDIGTCEGR